MAESQDSVERQGNPPEIDRETDVFLDENRSVAVVDQTSEVYKAFTISTLVHGCLCEVFDNDFTIASNL